MVPFPFFPFLRRRTGTVFFLARDPSVTPSHAPCSQPSLPQKCAQLFPATENAFSTLNRILFLNPLSPPLMLVSCFEGSNSARFRRQLLFEPAIDYGSPMSPKIFFTFGSRVIPWTIVFLPAPFPLPLSPCARILSFLLILHLPSRPYIPFYLFPLLRIFTPALFTPPSLTLHQPFHKLFLLSTFLRSPHSLSHSTTSLPSAYYDSQHPLISLPSSPLSLTLAPPTHSFFVPSPSVCSFLPSFLRYPLVMLSVHLHYPPLPSPFILSFPHRWVPFLICPSSAASYTSFSNQTFPHGLPSLGLSNCVFRGR